MSDEWGVQRLDLPAYLARIGERPGDPDGATLTRLHRAHLRTIAFENLDIILGRGVAVDLDTVQDKLVARGRGGYCHEHGLLFAAALSALGFDVVRLLARPGHHPDRPRPRTHLTLRVTGRDGTWLADVGFGTGLLEPLPWQPGTTMSQGDWTYRLLDDGRQVQEHGPDGWQPLYTITTDAVHASDVETANHYTATHPASPFVGRLIVMKRNEHRSVRLLHRTFDTTTPDGTSTAREIDHEELLPLLRDEFGIAVTAGDLAGLDPSGAGR